MALTVRKKEILPIQCCADKGCHAADGFDTIQHAEFLINAANDIFHHLKAPAQFVGDLFVGESVSEAFHHHVFTLIEHGQS